MDSQSQNNRDGILQIVKDCYILDIKYKLVSPHHADSRGRIACSETDYNDARQRRSERCDRRMEVYLDRSLKRLGIRK